MEEVSKHWGSDEHKKPYGFSYFPYEIICAPNSWCDASGGVTFYRVHKVSVTPPPSAFSK